MQLLDGRVDRPQGVAIMEPANFGTSFSIDESDIKNESLEESILSASFVLDSGDGRRQLVFGMVIMGSFIPVLLDGAKGGGAKGL